MLQQAHESPLTLFNHCMVVYAQHAMPVQQAVAVYRELFRTDYAYLTLQKACVQRIFDQIICLAVVGSPACGVQLGSGPGGAS